MKSDRVYDHRRKRLATWMQEAGLTGRDIANTMGWSSAAHVTNLLRGHAAFGEKVARRVETGLGMPLGYLDQNAVNPEENAAATAYGPSLEDVCAAVIALRDRAGPAFMTVSLAHLAVAVRLVLRNPDLVGDAASLIT